MERFRSIICRNLACAVLVFSLLACSSAKSPKYKSKDDAPTPSTGVAIFPHTDDWGKGPVHGKYVIDNDHDSCKGYCHGENFEGGNGRSCKSCHPLVPHGPPDLWPGLLGHGKYAKDNGTERCNSCHGADLAGGYDPAGKKSCMKCHQSYPVEHKVGGWSGEGHGKYVLDAGNSEKCTQMCHRSDVPAEFKLKICSDCHESYPDRHKAALWNGGRHFEYIDQHGGVVGSGCKKCHGEGLVGGAGKTGCLKSGCHHKEASNNGRWKDATEHALAAASNILTCLKCHGMKSGDATSAPLCETCHHKDWGDTHEKPWGDISQHGAEGRSPAQSCRLCHGQDMAGGSTGVACSSCHGDIYPHPDNWPNKDQHGLMARDNMDKCVACHLQAGRKDCNDCHHNSSRNWLSVHFESAIASTDGCRVCHGADLVSGTNVAKGCAYEDKCHAVSQHRTSERLGQCCADAGPEDEGEVEAQCWECRQHVPYSDRSLHAGDASADIARCKLCHGEDFKGGLFGGTCYRCHDPGLKYPHPENWPEAGQHGISFIGWRGTGRCMTACHGTDLEGGLSGIRCKDCHNGVYPHPDFMIFYHEHGELILTDGGLFDAEGAERLCSGCHEEIVPLTNEWPERELTAHRLFKCNFCHRAYPHLEYTDANGGSRAWSEAGVHNDYILNNEHFGRNARGGVISDSCGFDGDGACHRGIRQRLDIRSDVPACNTFCHSPLLE